MMSLVGHDRGSQGPARRAATSEPEHTDRSHLAGGRRALPNDAERLEGGGMSTEFVERLFKRHWPRMYLDTAELITIGRNQLPGSFIDEFLATLKKHSVVLVISHAHLCDALKPDNRDAPEFVSSTLQRFWIRGLVDIGPRQVEPWMSGPVNIELLPWNNVREVLQAPEAPANLAEHDTVQTLTHAVNVAFKLVQRSAPSTSRKQLSKNHQAIVAGAAYALAVGLRSDAEAAVNSCAKTISCTLTSAQRAALVERASPAEAMLQAMSPLLTMISHEERLSMLRHEGWPGRGARTVAREEACGQPTSKCCSCPESQRQRQP